MGVHLLEPIDNLDTRREAFYLLSRLPGSSRIEFLHWCARNVNAAIRLRHDPPWVLTEVRNDTGEVMESYADLMGLICQWGMDADAALRELERRVSRLPAQSPRIPHTASGQSPPGATAAQGRQ